MPAVMNMQDAVRDLGQRRVMGDDDAGLALGFVEFLQSFEHQLAHAEIQVAGGLIAQDQDRVLGQRPGHGYPLLLAAGKLRGEVVHPVLQPDDVEQAAASREGGTLSRDASSTANSTFSLAVSDGIRLKNWKTKPIFSRRR